MYKVVVAFVQSPGFDFVLRKFLLSDCGWYLKIHALWSFVAPFCQGMLKVTTLSFRQPVHCEPAPCPHSKAELSTEHNTKESDV